MERGGRRTLADLDLQLPAGTYTCVLGASGSGKTTLLSAIAGTLKPAAGRVEIFGELVSDAGTGFFVAPERRRLGMVFQDYLLWSHLSVANNIGLSLRSRHGRARAQEMAREWLALVGLGGLERRYPTELSGGQQQRVALARALAVEPRWVLLDEPLSALDAGNRTELRGLLRRLGTELGFGAVHVTHDATEALSLAQRLILMDAGRIIQIGAPEDVFLHPVTAQAARLTGPVTLIPTPVLGRRGDAVAVQLGETRLCVAATSEAAAADEALLVLRAQAVSSTPEPGAAALRATLHDAHFVGDHWQIEAEVGPGARLSFRADRRPQPEFEIYLRPERVWAVRKEQAA